VSAPTPAMTAAIEQLNANAAENLLYTLADRFGWEVALWTRGDADEQLFSGAERDAVMAITDEQWQRVSWTYAWTAISDIASRNVADAGTIGAAITQACLSCAACGVYLADPPEVTWSLCEDCRSNAAVADLLTRACPACDALKGQHDFADNACRYCGLPDTDPRTVEAPRPSDEPDALAANHDPTAASANDGPDRGIS
jgi:hypothetical protein